MCPACRGWQSSSSSVRQPFLAEREGLGQVRFRSLSLLDNYLICYI
jgi:hypothetical protein